MKICLIEAEFNEQLLVDFNLYYLNKLSQCVIVLLS